MMYDRKSAMLFESWTLICYRVDAVNIGTVRICVRYIILIYEQKLFCYLS